MNDKIIIIRGGSEDTEFTPRYVIVNKETGEIIDDAQGYGYKTKRNAYACYGYKNRDKSKDAVKKYKKRCVKRFCMKNASFINFLEQIAFEIYVGKRGPDENFDAKFVSKIFKANGYVDLDFTIGEFLRYWDK